MLPDSGISNLPTGLVVRTSYTGLKTVNGTFTMTVHGTGSDGSSFKVHETDHFNTTPTGAEFFFTRCHD